MALIESFRAVRWVRTLNLVLQAVLFLTFFGGLNYVAKNHPSRFDLTAQRKFSISPESLSYLKNLERPVHIIMTMSPEVENTEVKGLIDEYVYASEDRPAGRISKETLDVYQNRKRAEELGIDQAGIIVLRSGDRTRVVTIDELYTLKNKKRDSFHGEQTLTAAILDVSSATRRRIYFLTGHSELKPSDSEATRGLSGLRDQLKLRNFEIEEVDLTVTRKVPPDAALLVAVAPQSAYSRAEQELLRQYLGANAGRMILMLAANNNLSTTALGLDDLLLDWGVLVHNDVILDTGPENVTDTFDLLIWAYAPHPITKTLIDAGQKLRLGMARTVVPDPGRTLGNGLKTVTLAATSPTAWGERGLRPGVIPRYDPGIDTRPIPGMDPPDRLGLIVASERLAVRDNLPFSVRGGKLVVFGTGDLFANARLDTAGLMLALNSVNWTVDRDTQLSIPPRPVERFELALSTADFSRLRLALLLGLPGAAMLLGLIVYWTRRA